MANNKQQANIGAWDAMMAKVAGQPEIERLRAEVDRLRAREQALEAADEDADETLVQAVQEMKRLKDENTRLRAENQRLSRRELVKSRDRWLSVAQQRQAQIQTMRPVVEAVAEHIGGYVSEHFRQCAFCGNGAVESRIIVHANDCEVEQARAFVAAHPTAAGEAESGPASGVTFADNDGSDPDAYDEAESEA